MRQIKIVRYIILAIATTFFIACKEVKVHERLVNLPQHKWLGAQNAVVYLTITDSALHDLYFLIRHSENFSYKNIVANLTIQDTAKNKIASMRLNAPLVNARGNWGGTNMDNLYYHRIKINQKIFLKPGYYRFVLQQKMEEEFLSGILNVGIGIEPVQ